MSDFSQAQLTVLKALADGILAGIQRMPASNGVPRPAPTPQGSGDELDDSHLGKPWANKIVKKDPKRWTGTSMVGNRYADCPPEWHDTNAGFYEWKWRKGLEENPPRLRDDGKPWYENDAFEAKLSRAWARRLRANPEAREPAPDDDTRLAINETNTYAVDDGIPF